MAYKADIDYISQQIRTALARHIGEPYDPQKIVKVCRSMLSAAYRSNDVEVKIVEESEENKIVREIMEEPEPGICIESTIRLQAPIKYVQMNVVCEKLKI